MKVSIVCLAVLLALCKAQELHDPYQKVTYNIFYPGTTVICATWSLAGQFAVPYHRTDGTKAGEIVVMINLPQLPPQNGSGTQGSLDLSKCPSSVNGTWTSSLSARFARGEKFVVMASSPGVAEPTSWQVDSIRFTYDKQDSYYFPGGTGIGIVTVSSRSPDMLSIRAGYKQAYSCNATTDLTLAAPGQIPIPFSYKDMMLNPFTTSSTIGSTTDCPVYPGPGVYTTPFPGPSRSSSKMLHNTVGTILDRLLRVAAILIMTTIWNPYL